MRIVTRGESLQTRACARGQFEELRASTSCFSGAARKTYSYKAQLNMTATRTHARKPHYSLAYEVCQYAYVGTWYREKESPLIVAFPSLKRAITCRIADQARNALTCLTNLYTQQQSCC